MQDPELVFAEQLVTIATTAWTLAAPSDYSREFLGFALTNVAGNFNISTRPGAAAGSTGLFPTTLSQFPHFQMWKETHGPLTWCEWWVQGSFAPFSVVLFTLRRLPKGSGRRRGSGLILPGQQNGGLVVDGLDVGPQSEIDADALRRLTRRFANARF